MKKEPDGYVKSEKYICVFVRKDGVDPKYLALAPKGGLKKRELLH